MSEEFLTVNHLTENGEYIPPEPGSAVCADYDPAGIDAIDSDGYPQCAACGWPKSFHAPAECGRLLVVEWENPPEPIGRQEGADA